MLEPHSPRYRKSGTLACIGVVGAISGCALQADHSPPAMETPEEWSRTQGGTRTTETAQPFPDRWWTALHDPAIDTLVSAALSDSPTVEEFVARTDEARASLRAVRAQRLPSIDASASAARQRGAATAAGETELSSSADANCADESHRRCNAAHTRPRITSGTI
jgi:multidrug efflux system outer membrane protein